MKTHLDVLQEIAAQKRVHLQKRSDRAGLLHLASYLAALSVSTLWIVSGAPLWWVALPIQGLFLVFLFTLQHECTHETPFASPWLNKLVGHSIAIVLIQPFIAFRYFHLAHHRHTNDPERDPELLSGAKPDTWKRYIWHVSAVPYWFGGIRLTLQNAIAPTSQTYLPDRAKPRLQQEARWMLLAYAFLAASLIWSSLIFWIWLLPVLISAPFLRLYLLAEHGRCPPVANMLENTRTTFTNRFVRWLAWNMPYHIEHHSAPNVPFHQLPHLHREMKQDLITTSESYTAFTNQYAKKLT